MKKPWTEKESQAYRLGRYGHLVLWVPGSDGLLYSTAGMSTSRLNELEAKRDQRVQEMSWLLMDKVLEKRHFEVAINTPMRMAVIAHIRSWATLRLGGKYNITYKSEVVTMWQHSEAFVAFHCAP